MGRWWLAGGGGWRGGDGGGGGGIGRGGGGGGGGGGGEGGWGRRHWRGGGVMDGGDAVVLPGLVNAHTHLELSQLECGERPGSFVEWVKGVIRRTAEFESDPSFFTGGV